MFARLKGITEKRISTAIDELMKLLTLEQYADTLAGNYRWVVLYGHVMFHNTKARPIIRNNIGLLFCYNMELFYITA